MNESFLQKVEELFSGGDFKETYEVLSRTPVRILGDRVVDKKGYGAMNNEVLSRRLNIRAIITPDSMLTLVKSMLDKINPSLSASVTYITNTQINDFEKKDLEVMVNIQTTLQQIFLNILKINWSSVSQNAGIK